MSDLPTPSAGFDALAALERAGAATTVSLLLEDPNLTTDDYENLARLFGAVHSSARFHIGDLANFPLVADWAGDDADRYERIAELTGLAKQTVENYASLCRRVTRSRRRPRLTFGHHDAVRRLEPDAQNEWLAKAEAEEWSRDRLRDEIKAAGALPPPPEQPGWSDEWRTPTLPNVIEASPPETGNSSNGVASTTVTEFPSGPVATIVVAEPDLRESARLLVEAAEPLEDDRFYRVPRARLRELARLIEE